MLALTIEQGGCLDQLQTASDLANICIQARIRIPGSGENSDTDKAALLIGGAMSRLFKEGDGVEFEGFCVKRHITHVPRTDGNGYSESKRYTFSRGAEQATSPVNNGENGKAPESGNNPLAGFLQGILVTENAKKFQKPEVISAQP
jgi:hypothetical protein